MDYLLCRFRMRDTPCNFHGETLRGLDHGVVGIEQSNFGQKMDGMGMGTDSEGAERDGEHKLIANSNEMDVGVGREVRIAVNVAFCQTQCTSRDGKMDEPK